jgi:hypothetical protein
MSYKAEFTCENDSEPLPPVVGLPTDLKGLRRHIKSWMRDSCIPRYDHDAYGYSIAKGIQRGEIKFQFLPES